MTSPSIYVETLVRADLERVWQATQDPTLHRQWDLRFTEIGYLPKSTPAAPQQFLYATRIGFGMRIEGRGESVGTIEKNGERTSALKFWSDDPKSLIREGSGYWKYVPFENGVRFLTRYDYSVRFGPIGALLDRVCFRPLLGRATAWSFDCMRISLERGIPPASSIAASLACAASRVGLAAIWLWHGLVPKLMFPETGELDLVRGAHMFPGNENTVVKVIGVLEIVFALALLVLHRSKAILWVMIVALIGLLVAASANSPVILEGPFSPVSLTIAMITVAAMELFLRRTELPSASRCLRAPK